MAVYNISAGHNPDGKIACGVTGIIKESTEARNVAKEVIRLLREQGHVAYDCTCNNGTGQADVLRRITNKCNIHKVDVDVSVHFNRSNGKGHGTEVLYKTSAGAKWAKEVLNSIVNTTKLTSRGIKRRDNLYFLNKTKNTAILIECCFADNRNDVEKYNYKIMAKSIVEGLTGEKIPGISIKKEDKKKIDTALIYSNEMDKKAAEILQWKKKKAIIIDVREIDKYSIENIYAIGAVASNIKYDIKIQGKDRFDTIQKVLDYINNK